MNPVILIPARMASTRLPGKPLAMIGDAPMIVQVWRRAMAAKAGPVYVACAEQEIADAVTKAGGQAVLTDPNHPSGSDRIFEALQKIDAKKQYDVVVNLQGDMPLFDSALIAAVLEPLKRKEVDIATLATPIKNAAEREDSNIVKPIVAFEAGEKHARALNFTRRTPPAGMPAYHHIGIYAYQRAALEKFVSLPPSANEKREKLEQLRALDAGMHIEVALVDTVPLGVDTPEGLEAARKQMKEYA